MKSFHCHLIAVLSLTCLGVLLGAGDVMPRRLTTGNDFRVTIDGLDAEISGTGALPMISTPVAPDSLVQADLPSEDFVFVQVLPSDAEGKVTADEVSLLKVSLDATTRDFPLTEAVSTHEPLPAGHYLLTLIHKDHGQTRLRFQIARL